ncbi:MAG: hypothetical protein KDA73_10480 [Rhodobacteraceae bacterium]|nr:hypothetical protein [Paracoccaceae bacterium]
MIGFQAFRRRLAMVIYHRHFDTTKEAPNTSRVTGKALQRMLEFKWRADRVRVLIARYEAWTGQTLDRPRKRFEQKKFWEAHGMYEPVDVIRRMKDTRHTGLQYDEPVIRYFALIWPKGCPWPSDIPRPPTAEKAQ